MECAVVELKYVPKKFFIVRKDYIKNFKGKYSSFESVLCFISNDLSDEPNFVAKYSEKYDGEPGIFKVFIKKITEAAVKYLKESKRIPNVPKKYRGPQNTDSELNKEERKRKLKEKRIQKISINNASRKNASHLTDMVKAKHLSSEIENSDSDSVEKVTNEKNRTSLLGTLNNETQNTIQDDFSPSLTAKKPKRSATPSQIKINTSNISKVFPDLCSDKTVKKENNFPLPVSTATKPSPLNVVRNKNENYQLNAVERSQKCKNSLSVSTTALKPIQSKISSMTSYTSDNEVKQQNDLNPKNKGLPVRTKISKSIHTKAVVLPSSSSVVSKNQNNQTIVHNQKNKSQNELPATKVIKTETVTTAAAQKSSTASSTALLKRKTNSSENTASKKQKVVAGAPNDVEIAGRCIIKALKEENAHLKNINETLNENNEALMKALVVCTKSIPKPLSFEEKDGGRLYKCGIYLNKSQCDILDSITKDREFCNFLTVAVFGFEALKTHSVTGAVSNRTKGEAKPPLDQNGLKFIYDMMAIRTNNSILFSQYAINKIINKKIANLLAGDQPKRPRKSKKAATNNDCEEDDDYNDKRADEGEFEEDEEVSNIDENTQIDENENDLYNYDRNDENDEEQFEENNEATTNRNENTRIDENEGEHFQVDEAMKKGNDESYEHLNGLGDGIHESDMSSTGNIRLVNDAGETYFVVDMPDLQYDLMDDHSFIDFYTSVIVVVNVEINAMNFS